MNLTPPERRAILLRSDALSGRLADHTDLIEELRPWLVWRALHSSSVLQTPGFSPADYGTLRQAGRRQATTAGKEEQNGRKGPHEATTAWSRNPSTVPNAAFSLQAP